MQQTVSPYTFISTLFVAVALAPTRTPSVKPAILRSLIKLLDESKRTPADAIVT